MSTQYRLVQRLPAAAAQPAKVRQSCSATDYYYYYYYSSNRNVGAYCFANKETEVTVRLQSFNNAFGSH
jgi:hypothetical protein